MKKYKTGVVLGRFEPLHRGHVHVIEEALILCEKVLVLIGSSQERRTPCNPFSYEERENFFRKVFQDKILIAPLKDIGVGNVPAWGDYIFAEAEKLLGEIDALILGGERKNLLWLSEEKKKGVALVEVSRLEIPYSATMIREALLKRDFAFCKEALPKELEGDISWMVNVLLGIQKESAKLF